MPTVQDEEESLCLLASDLQESTTPALKNSQSHMVDRDKHWPCGSNQSDCNEDWDCDDENQSAFLSQGTAEKAFFSNLVGQDPRTPGTPGFLLGALRALVL